MIITTDSRRISSVENRGFLYQQQLTFNEKGDCNDYYFEA